MCSFSFQEQEQLLEIALNILEDYNLIEKNWSFGGGTALACAYYNHRMSYDIDIFSEDFSVITTIIENKYEIACNLYITKDNIESSPSGITFILQNEGHQLKIDFLHSIPLASSSYNIINLLGKENITTQKPIEIIAKKMKHRENITVRDYVDFAFAQKDDKTLSKLKKLRIVGLERFIDIWEQFIDISETDFNRELNFIKPNFMDTKECIHKILFEAFNPSNSIEIAINEENEILAIDDWIEDYREEYESIGNYITYTISLEKIRILIKKSSQITYNDIYTISKENLPTLLND